MNKARGDHDTLTVQGKFDELKIILEDADITVYWDDNEGEFVFSDDGIKIFEKLTDFFDQIKDIEDQFKNLTV